MKSVYLLQNEDLEREDFEKKVSELTLIPLTKIREIVDLDQVFVSPHYMYNVVRSLGYDTINDLLEDVENIENKEKISIFEFRYI